MIEGRVRCTDRIDALSPLAEGRAPVKLGEAVERSRSDLRLMALGFRLERVVWPRGSRSAPCSPCR